MKLALALLCLSTAAWAGPAPWIGLSLEEGDSGARVRQVMENSPGQRAGIKEGEQVVEGPYRTLARELQDGNAVKVQQPKPGPGGAPGPQGGRS